MAINTDSEHKKKLVEFYGGFKRNLKLDKLLPMGYDKNRFVNRRKKVKEKTVSHWEI